VGATVDRNEPVFGRFVAVDCQFGVCVGGVRDSRSLTHKRFFRIPMSVHVMGV
jgi:hypothetical protein